MPLFRVEAEFDVVFFAEDEAQAEIDARDAVREALRWESDGFVMWGPNRVKAKDLDRDWLSSYPYNRETDDSRSCEQILEAEEEAERKRVPTAEEIEAAGQQRLVP
jgi:hypothetical protein